MVGARELRWQNPPVADDRARPALPPLVVRLRAAGCVFAEEEAAQLQARFPDGTDREHAVRRREQGTPLEHVLGFALFAGTQVAVDPAVFVPRRRAEPLVDLCVTAARSVPNPLVVDLGCGSGAIAAAVSARLRRGTVVAVDADPVAVACARRNGAEHGFEVYAGDWFDGLPASHQGCVDVAVAYLPHVPIASLDGLQADYRTAEPLATVDGGADGLDPLRAVLHQAPRWLRAEGEIVTMSATGQEADVRAVAAERGWRVRTRADDEDDDEDRDDVFYVLSPPVP